MTKLGHDEGTSATPEPPGALDAIRLSPGAGDEAYDIRIAADGSWHHNGRPILRPALVKLFSTVLRREADGSYWLVTPAERGRITVDDAPFLAVGLDVAGAGQHQVLRFRTNVDDEVMASAEHPIRVVFANGGDQPRPYVLVRDRLEALLTRAIYYALVDLAVEHQGRVGVWSDNTFFPLDRP